MFRHSSTILTLLSIVAFATWASAATDGPETTHSSAVSPVAVAEATETTSQSLIDALVEAEWQYDAVASHLPPQEASYEDARGPIGHAFFAGDLRIYESADDRTVFAVMANMANEEIQSLVGTRTSSEYFTLTFGTRKVIIRTEPIDVATFDQLRARLFTEEELRTVLGEPTYASHVHGVGTWFLTYVPEGLTFYGVPNEYVLVGPDGLTAAELELIRSLKPPVDLTYAADYPRMQLDAWMEVARERLVDSLPFQTRVVRDTLLSPNGTYTALVIDYGAYWQNWIYIIRPGMAELRYRADSWISDAHWVDDNTFRWSTDIAPQDSGHYWVVDVARAEVKK